MTEYHDELSWAYHGEVYGEAMFAEMAAQVDDRDRAARLGVMAAIERQTKEQLGDAMDRAGLDRADEPEIEKGRKLALRAARADWQKFLNSFAPLTGDALERYRIMRDKLAPAEDADAMRALVTHEVVLQAYADRALAGDDRGIECIVDALEGEHLEEARRLLDEAASG